MDVNQNYTTEIKTEKLHTWPNEEPLGIIVTLWSGWESFVK